MFEPQKVAIYRASDLIGRNLAKKQGFDDGQPLVCSRQMRLSRGVLVTMLGLAGASVSSCGFPDYVVVPSYAALCSDLLLNGAETDTDCGGADCRGCGQGRTCAADRDCGSKRCVKKACAVPACDDGVMNGTETGNDCGGNCAAQKCPAGEGCVGGTDCESQVCARAKCQAPTCDDSTRNGGESDRDCGGGTCEPCSDGSRCNVDTDCAGKLCDRNTCVPVHCTDDLTNEGETDLNCGGPCAKCDTGRTCERRSDCISGVCTDEECAAPACDDEVQNGDETDLDCGGGECEPCGDSLICLVGSDCLSEVCQGGICQPATCEDTVTNGDETDVDCGSACDIGCADGQDCVKPIDCSSGVCDVTCQAASCDDEVVNGSETDEDCGGDCDPCLTGKECRVNRDCVTDACVQGVCKATLQVFYRISADDRPPFVRPVLQVRNSGPTSVALTELELRYFYTNDGFQNEVVACYFASSDCKDLVTAIAPLTPARPRADHYLSIEFTAKAGSVPVNGSYGLELAVNEPSYANYDQDGDYSYDPEKTAFAAHEAVTLYRKGTLIWGTEPPP